MLPVLIRNNENCEKKLIRLWVNFVQLFVKVHNEKVHFQKAECLVKAVKKCFLKKLSV